MKILVPTDGSPHSQEAIDEVARRPWPADTTIRVISAVQPIPPAATDFVFSNAASFDQLYQEQTKTAEQLTRQVADSFGAVNLSADSVVRMGDPRSVIVDEAKEWGADLIVMGSHGRTGLKRWLLGSVAESVVAHSPCSVEVVRSRHRD